MFILRRFFPNDDAFYLSGDLKEIYREILTVEGRFAAWRWTWKQVLI